MGQFAVREEKKQKSYSLVVTVNGTAGILNRRDRAVLQA
jgi:hypothetical protein